MERGTTCYFSTPERMRHCFPSAAAQIFICKGELRLDAEALTFLTPWRTRVVIPVKDIEDLSIGQFQMWTTPWVMRYERLSYLAVTYGTGGRSETIHLTPVPPGAASGQQINEQIGGWFEAIQKAVTAQRGTAPRVSEPRAVTISAEPAWNRKGVPLFIALLATFGLFVWRFRSGFGSVPEPLGIAVFVILWLLLMAVIWFSIGFLRANYALKRGDLDAVTSNDPPESLPLGSFSPTVKVAESFWVAAARWTARVLGTLLFATYALFVVGEGLPPIGSQPEGVQVSFVATGLMLLGFAVGWKREGTAALLIGSGWTLWHIAEGRIGLSAFHAPVPVAALYAFCWWAMHDRRTQVVVGAVALLAVTLGLGRLFCPTSVFVRGVVADAETGKPIPNAELTLEQARGRRRDGESRPNSRAANDGRFSLYVGWYAEQKGLLVSATGYTTLATNLGPRALGQRNVSRDYRLQRAGELEAGLHAFRAEAPATSSADPGPTFGPVREGAVYTDWPTTEIRVLDLDNGRSLDVPKTVVMASANNPRPMLNWMVQHGADLLVSAGDSSTNLWLNAEDGRLVILATDVAFESVTPSALSLGRDFVRPEAAQGIRLNKPESGLWPLIGFKTREGGIGVLQILEFTNSPCGVRFRYMLVGSRAATPATFGPVIERVLNDPDDRPREETLRLATGGLSSELTGAEKLGGGRIRQLVASPGDLYAEFDDWVGRRWALITAGLELSDLSPSRWDTVTVAEVRKALELRTVVPNIEQYGAILYLLPEGLTPMTFGFRTRKGDCGLLQVTGFTDNPRGVKIRYKLIRGGATKPAAALGRPKALCKQVQSCHIRQRGPTSV